MPILARFIIAILVAIFCGWQSVTFFIVGNLPFGIAVGALSVFNLIYSIIVLVKIIKGEK